MTGDVGVAPPPPSDGERPVSAHIADELALIEHLSDAVVMADAGGTIRYVNAAVERLLGWTGDDLVGRPLTTLQPRRLHAAHDAGFRRCLADRQPRLLDRPLTVPALRRDGTEVHVELTLSVVRSPDGEAAAVASMRDLSTRVELERQLRVSRYLQAATQTAAMVDAHSGPQATGRSVVEALIERLGAAAAELWLAEHDGDLRLSATAGTFHDRHRARLAEVVRTHHPLDVDDVRLLPLLVDGALEGVLVCRVDSPVPVELAEVLPTFGVMVAARLRAARLFAEAEEARVRSDLALERAAFLGAAGRILSSSLDHAETLQRVADLVVPDFADWCVVDVLHDGLLQRMAVAHREPRLQELARRLTQLHPSPPDAPAGAWQAVRTGATEVVQRIPQALLDRYADQPEHLELMRRLGFGAYVAVPLVAHERTLGTIVCYFADEGHAVDDGHLATLESLGSQAALAVDNARLVADLQAASQRSEASLAQLDALFHAAPIGLSLLDADLRHLRANERLAAMLGREVDELRERTAAEVLGEAGARTERVFRRVLHTGQAILDRAVTPGPELTGGRERAWRLSSYPVNDSSGDLLGVGAILEDVTDRVRTTQLLDRERRFLAAVLDNLEVAVVACDADGVLTVYNGAAEEFHGVPMSAVPPERWADHYDLYQPDGVTRMSPDEVPLMRALHGEVVRDAEMVIAPSAGERRIVQCNAQALHDDQGRMIGAVVAQHDVTQRKRAEARLTRQALHDPLTALPNRLLLLDRMRQALAAADRRPGSVAVLFLDFDRFKLVNDSFGHDVGDQLLIAIADRLRRSVRPGDTVARLGGDEFVVLCEGIAGPEQAEGLIRRLEQAISATPLLEADGTELVLTASIGVAMADGDERAETLLRNADAAMYRAKDRGRARHEIFDDSFRAAAVDRLRTESALRRALEHDRLQLRYQPIVELGSHRVVAVEALVRYHDPERGLVGPGEFLDVAEDTGLVVPIGAWAIAEACAQLARWRRASPELATLRVSVNLSARQLADPGLVATLERTLRHEGLPASSVSLEITESVLIEAAGSTLRVLDRLKRVGARLGIDDFGTGYSSLTYLRRFPVDFVKIDQSFVAGLGADPEDTAIVTAVVRLGQALGLTTVAEGVETSDQLGGLRDLGCDRAQGYHIARPQPAQDLTAAMARWAMR